MLLNHSNIYIIEFTMVDGSIHFFYGYKKTGPQIHKAKMYSSLKMANVVAQDMKKRSNSGIQDYCIAIISISRLGLA